MASSTPSGSLFLSVIAAALWAAIPAVRVTNTDELEVPAESPAAGGEGSWVEETGVEDREKDAAGLEAVWRSRSDRCAQLVDGAKTRRLALRRRCQCNRGFSLQGEGAECQKFVGERRFPNSLPPGACRCVSESTKCAAGVYLEVVMQPQLGLLHLALPASGAPQVFASFVHKHGCEKEYSIACVGGFASISTSVHCPDTPRKVKAADLPGAVGPFKEDWEICSSNLGTVKLQLAVINEVWGGEMGPDVEVQGCLHLGDPAGALKKGLNGSFEAQDAAVATRRLETGGCPGFVTEADRIRRAEDFRVSGMAWWMRKIQKTSALRARNFAGQGNAWDRRVRLPFSNLFNIAFIKFAAAMNRTKAFRAFADVNCGEPYPFAGGPMIWRYADVAGALADPTQGRSYTMATVEQTDICFDPTFITFQVSGAEEHTELRAILDQAGFDRLQLHPLALPAQHGWEKRSSPPPKVVGRVVLPIILRAIWEKEATQKEIDAIMPYLDAGPKCIFGQVAKQLKLLPKRAVRKARNTMESFAKDSPMGERLATVLEGYPASQTFHAKDGRSPEEQLIRNMGDLTMFSAFLGVTDMTTKCIKFQWNDARHVDLYREDRTSYLQELMRFDSAVTSFTMAFKKDQPMVLEGINMTWPAGTAAQMVIATANRDNTAFERPDEFDPARPDLLRQLSWNGALSDVIARDYEKAPRFCPGYDLSMKVAEAVCDHFTNQL